MNSTEGSFYCALGARASFEITATWVSIRSCLLPISFFAQVTVNSGQPISWLGGLK